MKKLIEKTKDTLSIFHSSKGFTLLELLVVVLIIGILATIALPQYQKTVKKAKLAELDVIINTAKKNVQLYIDYHGWPTGSVTLSGLNGVGDIEMPGNCLDNGLCLTNVGEVDIFCSSQYCQIRYSSQYNGSTITNPQWLGGTNLDFILYKNTNTWVVTGLDSISGTSNRKLICQWLKDRNYPTNDSKQTSFCNEVGVEIDIYNE